MELEAPRDEIDLHASGESVSSHTVSHWANIPSSADLLASIVGAEQAETFRRLHFQRRPVVFRGDASRLPQLEEAMGGLDLDFLLEQSASESVQVWLREGGATASEKLDSIQVDGKQAAKLFRAGHSLYCRAPTHIEELFVPRMLHSLGYGPRPLSSDRYSRGEVEMFYSRHGHVTDFHADFQENLTIQLSGTKQWIFGTSPLDHPLRGFTPHFDNSQDPSLSEQQLKLAKLYSPDFEVDQVPSSESNKDGLSEIVLHPGDVLYHPAGVWHRVICNEDSVSINVSLTVSSYADLVCCGLLQLLSKHKDFRAGVRAGKTDVAHSKGVIAAILEDLPRVLNKLKPEDFLPPVTFYNHDSLLQPEERLDEESEAEESAADENNDGNESDAAFIDMNTLEDSPVYELSTLYSRNPLSILLLPKERGEEAVQDCTDLIVHSVFGNENFESLTRARCRIPSKYLGLLKIVDSRREEPFTFEAAMGEAGLSILREGKRKRAVGDMAASNINRFVHLLLVTGVVR